MRLTPFPLLMVLTLGLATTLFSLSGPVQARAMPEFNNTNPEQWFNSTPLKRADLKGKVVLLDVWTYGCWNCYRSFPWLRSVEAKFANANFTVIGIHSPEFDHEKDPDKVAENVKKFGSSGKFVGKSIT